MDNSRGCITKHINYDSNSVLDLQFENQQRFMDVFDGIDFKTEFVLSDYFIIVRNGSRFDANYTCNVAREEAYQFVGSLIIFVNGRNLSENYPCDQNGTWGNMSNGTNGTGARRLQLNSTNDTINGTLSN